MFKTLRYSSMLKTVTLTIIINCSGDQSIETIFNEELENIKIKYIVPNRYIWRKTYDDYKKTGKGRQQLSGVGFHTLPWGYELPRTISLFNAIS